MQKTRFVRVLDSIVGNRKSKIQNRKWIGMIALIISFALCGFMADAQPKKVPRLGYLSAVDADRDYARSEAIRRHLRELGYIEGQNIAIEY